MKGVLIAVVALVGCAGSGASDVEDDVADGLETADSAAESEVIDASVEVDVASVEVDVASVEVDVASVEVDVTNVDVEDASVEVVDTSVAIEVEVDDTSVEDTSVTIEVVEDASLEVDDDTSQPDPVAIFVAQGDLGRTTVSRDDGRTWVDDRSWETEGDPLVCGAVATMRCYEPDYGCSAVPSAGECDTVASNCDCDHHNGAPMGVTFGDGVFVATWGWGHPGTVRKSVDGVHWDAVLDGHTYGGIGFVGGRFVVGDRAPQYSADGGDTWHAGGAADLHGTSGDTIWNVRRFAAVTTTHGGRFVMTGETGAAHDVLISSDGGASWQRPTTLPAACGADARAIAGGGAHLVVSHGGGHVCVSDDGGVTFETAEIGGDVTNAIVYDGERFITWGVGTRYTSSDGRAWTAEATTPANLALETASRSDATGTIVGVRGGWRVWYDAQEFYRSVDGGLVWEVLPKTSFHPSHRIRHITSARILP